MFASENLFKSIPCPYFSQATNTCTCERPYCPFKHSVQYETVSGSAQATTSSQLAEDKSIANKEVKSSNEGVEAVSKQQQPTNALENLSNALQTIQDLIKTAPNLVAAASSGATDLPNADILSKLSNLFQSASQTNSVASGSGSTSTTTTEVKKSESKSLKRQQSVPDYTPTPINELKKLKHKDLENDEDDDQSESSQPKRRVKNEMISSQMQSSKSEEVLTTRKKFESGEGGAEKPKRLKSDADNEEKTEKQGESSDNEAKKRSHDLVTFSKLTLSQQVLKRYELLNKPIPTQSQLAEAKLKKKLGEKDAKKQVGDKNANLNTPQLILDDNTSQKVPLALRSRHLKVIFDNTRPLYADLKEAAQKSSESEKSIYDRAKNKMIYANLIAILIKNLRSQLVEKQQQTNNSSPTNQQSMYKYNKPGVNISPQASTSFSYEMMLSGPKAVNYTIGRSKPIEIKDLSVTQLYELFYSYILNDKQLTDNSFPRWMTNSSLEDAEKRLAYIPNFSKGSNQTTTTAKKSSSTVTVSGETIIKNCKRCKSTFHLISSDGRTKRYATSNSECVYHWGKLRSIRFDRSVEQRYSCCSGGLTTEGCEIGKHVYDGDYDGHGTGQNISDYVETREASTSEQLLNAKTSKNIYALDCEMCYTAHGLELARVSIVDVEMRDVYEALVRPEAEVLDYNTRWSGLTAQTYADADRNKHAAASGKVKTLREVQADLVRLFNKDTILIGHSLESDFKALKLVHSCVVDTSVVFPHKAGPPLKRALRNLMSEYLQKIIQEDVDGHDSKEDATSCIQLMLWKIEEDLKSKKKQAIFSSSSQPSTSSSSAAAAATMTKTTSLNLNINQKPAPSIPTSSQQHPPQKLNNVYKLNNLNSNNKTLSVTPTKKSPSNTNTNIPPAQRKSNEFNVDKDKYKYTKINNNNSANAKNPTTQGNNGNSSSNNQKQKIKI